MPLDLGSCDPITHRSSATLDARGDDRATARFRIRSAARVDLSVVLAATADGVMWRQYGEYLARLKDEAYRDHVFAYVEREDTPRPLMYQLDLLREAGFAQVDVLHKNVCFAAFGGVRG